MDKPAILQDSRFVVEEGWSYRFFRAGSIQLNRLMFTSLILLVIWFAWGTMGGETGCVENVPNVVAGERNGSTFEGRDLPAHEDVDDGQITYCSIWFSPTTKFLGAMALLSFIVSIIFGALGLVVGKKILEMTSAQDEVGARTGEATESGSMEAGTGDADGAGPADAPAEASDAGGSDAERTDAQGTDADGSEPPTDSRP